MFHKTKPEIQPMPRTIQHCYSKEAGSKYWANTCPFCKSVQGDYFLHAEPEGPFFGTDIEYATGTFEKDLMKVAFYASYCGLLENEPVEIMIFPLLPNSEAT
jgi:hypothetical protein